MKFNSENEEARYIVKKRLSIELDQNHKEDYYKNKYYYSHLKLHSLRVSLSRKTIALSKARNRYKYLYRKYERLRKKLIYFPPRPTNRALWKGSPLLNANLLFASFLFTRMVIPNNRINCGLGKTELLLLLNSAVYEFINVPFVVERYGLKGSHRLDHSFTLLVDKGFLYKQQNEYGLKKPNYFITKDGKIKTREIQRIMRKELLRIYGGSIYD